MKGGQGNNQNREGVHGKVGRENTQNREGVSFRATRLQQYRGP